MSGTSVAIQAASGLPNGLTEREVFDTILAGTSVQEAQLNLDQLTADDRQTVLCTLCCVLDEIAANCRERAEDIEAVIEGNCSLFQGGERACGWPFAASLSKKVTIQALPATGT